jgi:signal transduction histidine kinase
VRQDPRSVDTAIDRALENVVRNSVRYTPSGGEVHIVGEYDVWRREVRLTIADEGPGVETAELGSIFEPFFRGQSAQATVGHGLGLAITRRVIQSHGGRISASNRVSGGLAVEICLPDGRTITTLCPDLLRVNRALRRSAR